METPFLCRGTGSIYTPSTSPSEFTILSFHADGVPVPRYNPRPPPECKEHSTDNEQDCDALSEAGNWTSDDLLSGL